MPPPGRGATSPNPRPRSRTARGTALHEAALCGKKDVVKYLLDSNVNLELRDHDDKTVLEVMDGLNTPMTREIIHLVLGE